MMLKKYKDLFLDNALLTPLKKVIDIAKEHGVEVGDHHKEGKGLKVGRRKRGNSTRSFKLSYLMNCSMTISFVETYSTHAIYIRLLT